MMLSSIERYQQSLQNFVHTDLESGIIFASIALSTTSEDKRERLRHHARKAYNAAMYFWQKVPSFADDRPTHYELLARFANLKDLLMQLGERFEE